LVTFIVVKPHGADHFIHGLNVTGNVFRTLNGYIDRVEAIDSSFADLNYDRMRNIVFQGNTFNAVDTGVFNPLTLDAVQVTASSTWTISTDKQLPFQGFARRVTGVVWQDAITNSASANEHATPFAKLRQGTDKDQIALIWPEATKGTATVTIRMDNPL